jgi:cell division protease FtsH
VRDMFANAKKSAPCIVFIDEIDAVGRHRGIGVGGGNDEREQTLNQLLVEMDGFDTCDGIIILAATNRPDVLDPALLRPGRFDRRVVVPLPDIKGRLQILGIHAKKVPLTPDVDLEVLARATPGFSGADLANLINEGALLAARHDNKVVAMEDLEYAKDKVMMGAERRSMVIHEDEKRITAYHESGHAIVAFYSATSDPLYKATIIPRGQALGMVMRIPERDKLSITRETLMADIAVACGGRVAECLVFGPDKITSGASSDIRQASDLASSMVKNWGMSPKMGFVSYDKNPESGKAFSDDTAAAIDDEVRALVDAGYKKAEEILNARKDELDDLAAALIKYETLSADEIRDVLHKKAIDRKVAEPTATRSSSFAKVDTKADDDADGTSESTGAKHKAKEVPKTRRKKRDGDGN